jgi:hypothetical protein
MRYPEARSLVGDSMCMSKKSKAVVWLTIIAISVISCYFIKYSPE